MLWGMAIGVAQRQVEFLDAAVVLGDALDAGSIYGFLAGHGHRLFGDDYFADLFVDTRRGRPTIPARVMAVTMLLQSFEGLSDREAVDRLRFDVRWRAAAGLTVEPVAFHPTVLVGLRNRLRPAVGRGGCSPTPASWLRPPAGWSRGCGCWTPRRCWTRSRPRTP